MRSLVLVSLMIVGCGKTSFTPSEVAPEYAYAFTSLAAYVNESAGYVMISTSETSKDTLVVDDKAIEMQNLTRPTAAFTIANEGGTYQTRIVLPSSYANGPLGRILMAHEIGHALGLHHTEQGVMSPSLTRAHNDCGDLYSECLVSALREQGIIP